MELMISEPQGQRLGEDARQCAVDALDILDTPSKPVFEAMVDVACALHQVPIAVVTFIDAHRQWFKARRGLEVSETARDIAFCALVVDTGERLVVGDALNDERFAQNPLVTGGPMVRFYAGVPLVLSSGARVGSLAIMDRVPRILDAAGADTLLRLARIVVDAIEQRVRAGLSHEEARLTREKSQIEARRQKAILQAALDGIVLADSSGCIVEVNPAAERIFGLEQLRCHRKEDFGCHRSPCATGAARFCLRALRPNGRIQHPRPAARDERGQYRGPRVPRRAHGRATARRSTHVRGVRSRPHRATRPRSAAPARAEDRGGGTPRRWHRA